MSSAAVYTRISDDKQGRALGVARQRAACEALAQRLGYDRTTVYEDNDVSASKGKRRDCYEQMLTAVEAGQHDAIVVAAHDRLTRRMTELVRLVELVHRTGIQVHSVAGGDYDLNTATGRQVAYTLGASAAAEAERNAERVLAMHDGLRAAGAFPGGPRAFGWTDGRRQVVETEASVVREAAVRVLAGEALGAIARDVHARGVTGTKGRPLTTHTLRQILLAEAVAGLRGGRPAAWAPLLPPERWEAVVGVLRDDRRRKGGRPRSYLLTGLAVCGRRGCGAVLVGQSGHYVCPAGAHRAARGCGRLRVVAEHVDVEVRDRVLAVLAGPGLAAALRRQGDAGAAAATAGERLRSHEARLERLRVALADGTLDPADFADARRRLSALMERERGALGLAAAEGAVLAELGAAGDLAAWWHTAPVAQRRAVVSALAETVEVEPARTRGVFDPDRVRIAWRV